MALLRLQAVTKEYQLGKVRVHALRGLDMIVEQGEILVVMGPSGSGKSTLMHILGCLDIPTAGTVEIEGVGIHTLNERRLTALRGKKIGFIFQTFNLVQTITAQANVELPMIFQGANKSERINRAHALLTKVGLGERMKHRPGELSGGERQRVAIARAFANDPEILLADEPTGNLDSETGKAILDLLAQLSHQQGKTVILVTHDPEAQAIAGRVITLKDGRVVKEERS